MRYALKKLYDRSVVRLNELEKQADDKRAFIIAAVTEERKKDTSKPAFQDDREAVAYYRDKLWTGANIIKFDSADAPELKEVYPTYQQNFPIESEQETIEGFRACLDLKNDASLQEKCGPFKEAWICVRDPETGKIIAAINFSTFTFNDRNAPEAKIHADGTQHLTFVFVAPEYRHLGIAKKLIGEAEAYSRDFIARNSEPRLTADQVRMETFTEQNYPPKMTVKQYIFDTLNAGIKQYARLKWWSGRGFAPLNFSYVQLALEKGAKACENVRLHIKKRNGLHTIPAAVVHAHIAAFFRTSVFKGEPIENDNYYKNQAKELGRMGEVKILPHDNFDAKEREIENIITNPHLAEAVQPNPFIGAML
ncbi:MAG: GNAT family N-acetyltransferase, partial [Alphaproteobacteria bacterium]|nr:GNAT family N-acetyltransferase [Alphaproteobacteria bacterium]